MTLQKYRKKRDFSKTPEPAGKKSKKEKELVFVVHKHNARRLHYDLRLEAEGVLKSWAVPKGMPHLFEDKKLAMMVEDHPFDYRHFEGVIPEGNYGAGEVIIWDEGTYHAINTTTRKESEAAVREGIRKGKISFIFEGKKLHGEYTLVKLKKGEENSWLLMKKKDEYETREGFSEESVKTGKTIEDMGSNGAKKAKEIDYKEIESLGGIKKPMPNLIRPMLASLVDEPFDKENWVFEIKWDGYRALAYGDHGLVRLVSRNDMEYKKFTAINQELSKLRHQFILDGEVVSLDAEGKASFQNLQNYINLGQGNIVYFVFDVLYLDGHDLRGVPLEKRKEILKETLPQSNLVRISEEIPQSGIAFYEAAKEKGLEGIVGKDVASIYESGKRSDKWLKIKILKTQEVVIGGFTHPRGSRKHIGSLLAGFFDDEGNLHFAGHLSVGSKEEKLSLLRQRLDLLQTDHCPFVKRPKANAQVSWVKPELVVESQFVEWTEEGFMRQPMFVGIREDKWAKEVVKEKQQRSEEVLEKKNYAIGNDKKQLTIDGITQEISNTRKIFWPKEGISKGEVIDYYRSVSRFILPHIKNRPQSLRRFPNGISGDRFYQKNMESVPPWIETVTVNSEGEERDIRYMLCQKEPDLVYMANLGCIEIHPWLSSVPTLDYPDFAVIDLDPLDVDFEAVVDVALGVHELLNELGLPSYVKTSGSTGMHIYLPMGAQYDYDQVVQFSKIIATMVHVRMPDVTSIERSPKKRGRKVYLDYLQNRKGQTIAAPYSIRPLPGAPVSTPLHWSEVNHYLDPSMFTMKTIHDRLRREGDIWKDIFVDSIVDMEKVLGRIEKLKLKNV